MPGIPPRLRNVVVAPAVRGQPTCGKDTPWEKKEKAPAAVVGFDVGKSSHRACAVAPDGAALFNRGGRQPPGARSTARSPTPGRGARVVVDQKRNIGALVVARARAAGNPVFYLPGIAMKKARDMFPATAKTDEIDAEVIARTAMGMPWTLREVARGRRPSTTALRMLASQRDFAVRSRTKAANRLRAVLLEADPAFEAAVDPSSRWQLAVLAELGGAFGIRAAGLRRFRSVAERSCGARRGGRRPPLGRGGRVGVLRQARARRGVRARALPWPPGFSPTAARRRGSTGSSPTRWPATRRTRRCSRCRAWGPRTAAALVTLVDASLFRSHDELAAYTGLAPCNRQSGTSLNSTSPSRGGNRALKNLLVYSCTSLVGTKGRFGRYYGRVPGPGHASQQGPQGGCPQAPEGHLCGDARQGPVPGGLAGADIQGARPLGGRRQHGSI